MTKWEYAFRMCENDNIYVIYEIHTFSVNILAICAHFSHNIWIKPFLLRILEFILFGIFGMYRNKNKSITMRCVCICKSKIVDKMNFSCFTFNPIVNINRKTKRNDSVWVVWIQNCCLWFRIRRFWQECVVRLMGENVKCERNRTQYNGKREEENPMKIVRLQNDYHK